MERGKAEKGQLGKDIGWEWGKFVIMVKRPNRENTVGKLRTGLYIFAFVFG
jgi:hypothetical protein